MKPGSDAAGIGTLANLRFAYRIKTNPLEKCGKPDFFGAERSEARKKAARKKFSQGAEVFLLYFLMNPSVFLK